MSFSRSMVHWALYSAPGTQLTIAEIREKIFSEKNVLLCRNTVRKSLHDLHIYCSDIFRKETKRIGIKKIPVNHYSITIKQ
jgi:hypothetical protein